jgi:hypothetical protein
MPVPLPTPKRKAPPSGLAHPLMSCRLSGGLTVSLTPPVTLQGVGPVKGVGSIRGVSARRPRRVSTPLGHPTRALPRGRRPPFCAEQWEHTAKPGARAVRPLRELSLEGAIGPPVTEGMRHGEASLAAWGSFLGVSKKWPLPTGSRYDLRCVRNAFRGFTHVLMRRGCLRMLLMKGPGFFGRRHGLCAF